jgi:hypothetical protein
VYFSNLNRWYFLINIKFLIKNHYRIGGGVKGMAVSMSWQRGGMTAAEACMPY